MRCNSPCPPRANSGDKGVLSLLVILRTREFPMTDATRFQFTNAMPAGAAVLSGKDKRAAGDASCLEAKWTCSNCRLGRDRPQPDLCRLLCGPARDSAC